MNDSLLPHGRCVDLLDLRAEVGLSLWQDATRDCGPHWSIEDRTGEQRLDVDGDLTR